MIVKFILICLFFFVSTLTYSQNWQQVGLGAYINASTITLPQTFTVDTANNILYSNGNFKTALSDTIFGIASWNGIKWDSLSSGIQQGNIRDIAMYNGELYVVGGFTSAGGVPTKYIGTSCLKTQQFSLKALILLLFSSIFMFYFLSS